ncbi:MAG: hypothetical protein PHE14_06325 [Aminobacterium colombiense]|nr:hypothetical protein [Aminobacterium colombiense]MDD3768903.1 hypothetical protein [Aminobacterium colombiense]MDD4266045.1 hypothetical protein [Aminobacterium colombiense]
MVNQDYDEFEGAAAFRTVIQVITVPEDMVVYFLSYGYSNWGKVDLSKLFE